MGPTTTMKSVILVLAFALFAVANVAHQNAFVKYFEGVTRSNCKTPATTVFREGAETVWFTGDNYLKAVGPVDFSVKTCGWYELAKDARVTVKAAYSAGDRSTFECTFAGVWPNDKKFSYDFIAVTTTVGDLASSMQIYADYGHFVSSAQQ